LKPVFSMPAPESKEAWVTYVMNQKWRNMRASMEGQAIAREEILTRFAALTTKRLQAIRKSSGGTSNLRKADIKSSDLKIYLGSIPDPEAAFAAEVVRLDPDGKHAFKGLRLASTSTSSFSDNTRAIKEKLLAIIKDHSVYVDLEPKKGKEKEEERPPSPSFASGSGTTQSAVLNKINEIDSLTSVEVIRVTIKKAYRNGTFSTVQEVESSLRELSRAWKSKECKDLDKPSLKQDFVRKAFTDWVTRGKPLVAQSG